LADHIDEAYDGCTLAVDHSIIVVTINYRLGPLGFLVTQGDDGNTEGNYGFADQREAIRWVR
jgi:para-nitrobenzyl esterase